MRKTNVIAFIVASAVTIVVFCAALFLLLNAGASTEPILPEAEVSTSTPTSAAIKDIDQAPPEAVRPNDDAGPGFNTNAGSIDQNTSVEPSARKSSVNISSYDENKKQMSELREASRKDAPISFTAIRDAMDEAIYRADFIHRMSNDPYLLAQFLFTSKKLDTILGCGDSTGGYQEIVPLTIKAFNEDAELHQQALECAKEIFSKTHIDCNWSGLRKKTKKEPLVRTADGQPISAEPAGSWSGPADK